MTQDFSRKVKFLDLRNKRISNQPAEMREKTAIFYRTFDFFFNMCKYLECYQKFYNVECYFDITGRG